MFLTHAHGVGKTITVCFFPPNSPELRLAERLDRAMAESWREWVTPEEQKCTAVSRLCDSVGARVVVAHADRPAWAPGYRPRPDERYVRPFSPTEVSLRPYVLCLEKMSPPGLERTILRYVLVPTALA